MEANPRLEKGSSKETFAFSQAHLARRGTGAVFVHALRWVHGQVTILYEALESYFEKLLGASFDGLMTKMEKVIHS